jgi:hypothetical protein
MPRRNGNIARLPNATRNRVNKMLRDGAPYQDIIRRLGSKGFGLSKHNLSEWFMGGYQDWLKDNERLELMSARRARAWQIVKANRGQPMQQAALHLAASHVYELLQEFDPETLKENFKGDSADYARIARALSHVSDGSLKHEKHRAKLAELKNKTKPEPDPASEPGGLKPETLRKIEQQASLL